ncbi:homing endonuclease [Campylobacter phage NCTC12673]|uniref:Hef-like homing endonuclease n=2 Tax=Fletchervirus NCTC12673 TaxID=934027 RepID=A0A1B0XW86_9CAUD|nr:homing endonuclease [Campylobacter phage NCTC12673]YP_009321713.1 homing endonuclease [Campylobacter phage PC14]AEA86403.1 Hef58 [Campylobacter phage NCTC12673]ANH51406.1 hypothetical protein PC14_00113 [Campylobacter phage PC14]
MNVTEKLKFLNDLGYEVISENLGKQLQVKCKNGHVITRQFYEYIRGNTGCGECDYQAKLNLIKSYGFEVISSNVGNDMKLKCVNGHIFSRAYKVFVKGATTCPECNTNNILDQYKQLGVTLINKSSKQLTLQCSKGHTYTCTTITAQHKCPICIRNEYSSFMEALGYEIISEKLGNDLRVKCKNGHIFSRTFDNFKNGHNTCPECEKISRIQFIESNGFKLISENVGANMVVKCKNGHTIHKKYTAFKAHPTCSICQRNERMELLKQYNLQPITDNLGNELIVECENGHTFKRYFNNIKKGSTKCPICYPYISSFESEIENLLSDYVKNDRNVLNGRELDFYIPSVNLAIECNGDYWHSESNGRGKNYHLAKTNMCNLKGINLLHIFESSWEANKHIWMSIINNKLGKSEKIMARKCVIKNVSKYDERLFLENNHLQGFAGSSICYGLYFNNELVCLMSFGKPRFTNKYDWELIRLCTKMGLNIIGGASKLLSCFHKNHPGSLISYSDRLYSDGSVYKQLGFEFSHYSAPGYFYVKGGSTYTRYQFMKHKLKDKLEKFDPNLTESENMRLNGYHKVWDCGQGVWVKDIK